MKATTIKLDGALLWDLNALRRPDQNLTALVRELLKAQINRSSMLRAAEAYISFLRKNPAELTEHVTGTPLSWSVNPRVPAGIEGDSRRRHLKVDPTDAMPREGPGFEDPS
jgi:hypothetical protein